jgi:lipopolysaccharide export system protein LptA
MKYNLNSALCALVFCVLSATGLGNAGEITIEANLSEFDQVSGKHHLQGNVIAKQNGMILKAETIELTSVDGVVTLVVAEGNPTTLETVDGMTGRAKIITYNAQTKFVIFEIDAFVQQGQRSVQGQRIDADLASDFLRAEGEGDNRVKLSFPIAE